MAQEQKRKLAIKINNKLMGWMFRSVSRVIFLVCIDLFVLIDLSCFSFGPRSIVPIAPLSDKSQFILVSISTDKLANFKSNTNYKISSFFEENGISYLVLPRVVWEKMEKENSGAKEEILALGFKYYAENFQLQNNKTAFELSDMILGYKDRFLNEKYLTSLSEKFSDLATKEVIGETNSKNQILALRLTNRKKSDDQKLPILLKCAIHANEVITTDHCYDVIYTILTNKKMIERYLDKLIIWVIPIANPDGSDAFWNISHLQGRKNRFENNFKGVDLNRNFPIHWGKTGGEYSSNKIESPYYQGEMEASEAETQAFITLMGKERFVASISYHAFANALLYPYSIEGFLNPSPDLSEVVGKKITKNIRSTHPTKPFLLKKNLYPIDGVDQDYYYYSYGTLAYVLESSHLNPDYKYVPKILDSLRMVWIRLFDEIAFGEKIFIKVINSEGVPLPAKIRIKSITYFQGEARTNHPKTGIFYSYFVPALDGELEIESEGYQLKTIKIDSTNKWEIQNVVLRMLD
jgi:hypothetical protein